MGSIEALRPGLRPEELLRARNMLQIVAMEHFRETPEQWVEQDAAIAAHIFDEEPRLLSDYIALSGQPDRLKALIEHFEEEIEEHRKTWH